MHHATLISTLDHSRLVSLLTNPLDSSAYCFVDELDEKLAEATLVAPGQIPPDLVTMNSRVLIGIPGATTPREVCLTYPDPVHPEQKSFSVFSPIGSALLGARVGETVNVTTGKEERPVQVIALLYQPESSGDWEL
jgi:regulator of nucleoside diphosphate kinase